MTAGGATSGVIRSQPAGAEAYAPWAQCGWRVPRGDASRVTLTFRELGLDAMFDKVKVFRGGPPDSIGWTARARFAGDTTASALTAHGPFTSALDPDFAYQFTGTRLPGAPITVDAVAEHAGAAVAEIIKGRVVRLDRAVDAGRHGRRLGADVSRVITIILSRRPIVLSTFLSSG